MKRCHWCEEKLFGFVVLGGVHDDNGEVTGVDYQPACKEHFAWDSMSLLAATPVRDVKD